MRLLLPLTLAAVLLTAPNALANTVVSRASGTFGTGLSGDYIWVTDPVSITDQRMDVHVTRDGNEIVVTDDVGTVNARSGCRAQGDEVRCSALGLTGLRIEGGNQNDVLSSDVDLPAVFFADGGDDLVQPGPNNDQVHGDNGNDTLRGGAGNDAFSHEKGRDVFDGDGDRDTVSYGAAPSAVNVTLGDTEVNDGLPSEPDRLAEMESAIGSDFADTLIGSSENNTLSGRAGNDQFNGLDGNDLLNGGLGADDMEGDRGTDTATYEDRTVPVNVSIGNDANDGQSGEGDNVRTDVENLRGGAAGDVLSGSADANILDGNAGNDTLDGGLGPDQLQGDSGFDTADYSARTDDLELTPNSVGDNDGSVLDGPLDARDHITGAERTLGGTGNDTITGSSGVDAIDAGPGADLVNIRDGVNDSPVKCGVGIDTAIVDPFPIDFADPFGNLQLQDCEIIEQP